MTSLDLYCRQRVLHTEQPELIRIHVVTLKVFLNIVYHRTDRILYTEYCTAMKYSCLIHGLLAIVICTLSSTADTLYVSLSAPAGTGQSWQSPFTTIDAALMAWQSGDEVWVAQGTYAPPVSGWSFPNGLRMYGGFNGTELLREERDWFRKPAVLTGENIKTVFVLNDCDSSSRIDGFTLQGATEHALNITGGCPIIRNCTFLGNTGQSGAAILATATSRIHIEYCVFGRNTCDRNGGAVEIRNSSAHPYGYGALIGQCQFYDNTSLSGNGGALSIVNSPTIPQIVSCVFNGNQAVGGGALFTEQCYAYITNATFCNNNSTGTDTAAALTLLLNGGELLNSIVWNGTISDSARHIVHYLLNQMTDTTILRARSNLVENDFIYGFYQTNPSFEDEQLVAGADGFFGTDDDGLRLSSLSVALNAGVIDRYVNSRQTDAIGNPRLVGRKVDLGAYETQRPNRLTPTEIVEGLKNGRYSLFYRHSKTDWGEKDEGPSPECFPGRNLISEGRELATEVGKAQRLLGIPVGEALSSPVCRCWETTLLMCGRYEKVPYWGSGGGETTSAQRDSALKTPPPNGNRIISSHDAVANMVFNPHGDGQVLTSAELMECDNLFVLPVADTFEVVGHWCSDTWMRYHVRFPDEPTSVQPEPELLVVTCSPNPATTMIEVKTPSPHDVTIINMYGQVVWSGVVPTSAAIVVSDWPQGMYAVQAAGRSALVVVLH